MITNHNIRISTLNIQTLQCDMKLAGVVKSAQSLGIDILALQEVRRRGAGVSEFDDESIKGWQLVWSGFKIKAEAGVALLLAPHINLVDHQIHQEARILTAYINIKGMRVSLINTYFPAEMAEDSSKDRFYCNLRKSLKETNSNKSFKPILLGDLNSTIGMNSKMSGVWDYILGSNNSDRLRTNNNGERLLTFCSEHRLKIINSIFRTKRIHRGTWHHASSGIRKRIDYICTGEFVAKFIQSCRVYLGASKLFHTDHFILTMDIKFPTHHHLKQKLRLQNKNPKLSHKEKDIDVSVLCKDVQKREELSSKLDSALDTSKLASYSDTSPSDQDIEVLHEHLVTTIKTCLNDVCPNREITAKSEPWEDDELRELIGKQKQAKNRTALNNTRKEIKIKRNELKNAYYEKKANEINNAAEARQTEKEFALAKKRSMISTSSRINISKEKLTEHFKAHFAERPLPIPPEVENPETFQYLKEKCTILT